MALPLARVFFLSLCLILLLWEPVGAHGFSWGGLRGMLQAGGGGGGGAPPAAAAAGADGEPPAGAFVFDPARIEVINTGNKLRAYIYRGLLSFEETEHIMKIASPQVGWMARGEGGGRRRRAPGHAL